MKNSRNAPVQSLILDLGGVIIDLEIEATVRAFQRATPGLDPGTFLGKREQLPFLNQFETGAIETRDFIREFHRHYGSSMPDAEFKAAWNAMILGFPEGRVERVRTTAARVRTFLLSNINEIHEEALDEEYRKWSDEPFTRLFEKAYYSHRIGARKPDAEAFRRVLDENALDPGSTLFIDDTLQHIEGAERLGIRTHHLKPGESLEKILDLYSL